MDLLKPVYPPGKAMILKPQEDFLFGAESAVAIRQHMKGHILYGLREI